MLKEEPKETRAVKALAHVSPVTNGKKLGWRIRHTVIGFPLAAIVSFTLLYFSYLSSEAVLTLVAFNFMFVSLIFPLNGTLATKVLMLSLGNMIGLLWNSVSCLFVYALAENLGEFFSTSYLILSPFTNSMWIVTFYSLSLAILAKVGNGRARAET